MTQERILELAHEALLMKWGRFNEELKEMPENRVRKARERKAWQELEEIEKMIKGI